MSTGTTLNKIRAHEPCQDRWEMLLKHLGKTSADDEPLPFATIVESLGLDDALWCCQAAPEHDKEWRLFSVWCARQVQHLMNDERSIRVLDVAEAYAHGTATDDELNAAWDAARAAARALARDVGTLYAARAAARDAAWAAAWAAGGVASRLAASEAARKVVSAVARALAWAAGGSAARTAAEAAAMNAAMDAAMAAQTKKFLEIVGEAQ